MRSKIINTISIVFLIIAITLAIYPSQKTGKSIQDRNLREYQEISEKEQINQEVKYIGNKNTKKFHEPDCPSVQEMLESNIDELNCSREEAMEKGYSPCGRCNP